MASTASSAPRAATRAARSCGMAVPRTAQAQAKRTVEGPRRSRRATRPLPRWAAARSRSSGEFASTGGSPFSRTLAVSSTASKGLPVVTAQASRQKASSAWSPSASRTSAATAAGVSGARGSGRWPARPGSVRKASASAGSSSGR
ncbi:hypothetical protein WKI68_40340 [Streptomyces sp. MS1.HAVA.3]|uniref:Uncharacterized protein n=1 Tax=Streptomyces caledonius TaxID=3134107 RepID=A0ABU8UD05_9ACTN